MEGCLREHKPQRVSRAELERRLEILRANLPCLLRLFPVPEAFQQEFSSFAGDLTDRAGKDDLAWVSERIAEIQSECEAEREA